MDSLSVNRASLIISSCFLPTYVIRKLSPKWTIVLSLLGYTTYLAAQFHPDYYTLTSTAVIIGMAGSCLWTAQSVYITKAGEAFADHFGETKEESISKFFSVFHIGLGTSHIWGNIVSYSVFSVGMSNNSLSNESLSHCGANYCSSFSEKPTSELNSLEYMLKKKIEQHKMDTLAIICLIASFFGVGLAALYLKPIKRIREPVITVKTTDIWATYRQMLKLEQILLIPISVFCGYKTAFLVGDVTGAYISCAMGVHHVGYFMMTKGISMVAASGSISYFVKYFGQGFAFMLAFFLNLILLFLLFYWVPEPSTSIFSKATLIAVIFGVAGAIWVTQIHVYYGLTFADSTEAAFSNLHIWGSVGYVISFVLSSLGVCIRLKIYIATLLLLFGMACFGIVQWRRN